MNDLQFKAFSALRQSDVLVRFVRNNDVIDFIVSQFCLESDYLRSNLTIENNNICGMKKPYKRFTYANGVLHGFAKFESVSLCIMDYLAWVFYQRPYQNVFHSVENYTIFLRNSGYCPEVDYIAKIQSIYSQFKSYQNGQTK